MEYGQQIYRSMAMDFKIMFTTTVILFNRLHSLYQFKKNGIPCTSMWHSFLQVIFHGKCEIHSSKTFLPLNVNYKWNYLFYLFILNYFIYFHWQKIKIYLQNYDKYTQVYIFETIYVRRTSPLIDKVSWELFITPNPLKQELQYHIL